MADHGKRNPSVHDGRFGEQFDDEISSSGIWVTIVGVLGVMVLGMVAMVLFDKLFSPSADGPDMMPTERLMKEAKQVALAPAPRLQADPEGELEVMRHELAKRMSSYGWVDEAGGFVHIPVDQAMALVLERGLPAAQPAVAPADDETADADASLPGDGSEAQDP